LKTVILAPANHNALAVGRDSTTATISRAQSAVQRPTISRVILTPLSDMPTYPGRLIFGGPYFAIYAADVRSVAQFPVIPVFLDLGATHYLSRGWGAQGYPVNPRNPECYFSAPHSLSRVIVLL
jgi:hypothetical protein